MRLEPRRRWHPVEDSPDGDRVIAVARALPGWD
jgi:hypothetical protein